MAYRELCGISRIMESREPFKEDRSVCFILRFAMALVGLAFRASGLTASQRGSLGPETCIGTNTVILEVRIEGNLPDPRDEWVNDTWDLRGAGEAEKQEILDRLKADKQAGEVRDLLIDGDHVSFARRTCIHAYYRIRVRRAYASPLLGKGSRLPDERPAINCIRFVNPCPLAGESIIYCGSGLEFSLSPGSSYLVMTNDPPVPNAALPYKAATCFRAERIDQKGKLLAALRSARQPRY